MSFKKLIVPAFCAFTVLVISVGCKKSNNSTNSGSISASMGSTAFNSNTTNTVAWYSTDSAVYEIGGFSVNNKDTSGIAIEFFPPFTLGKTITDPNLVD